MKDWAPSQTALQITALFMIALFVLYFLTPLYLALFLAFTLSPLFQWIRKSRVSSWLLLIGTICITLLLFVTVPYYVYAGLKELTPAIENLIQQLRLPIHMPISPTFEDLIPEDLFTFETMFQSIQVSSKVLMESVLFVTLFSMACYQFYKDPLWFLTLFHSSQKQRYAVSIQRAQQMAYLFFKNEAILIIITWAASSLFLYSIHFPQPILIGFVIAILDLVPFVGVSVFYIPLMIILFASDQILTSIYCLVFFLFLISSRHFIEPMLWKNAVQVPSLVLLIFLSSSVLLLGVKGLLLIPLCFVLFSKFIDTKKPDLL